MKQEKTKDSLMEHICGLRAFRSELEENISAILTIGTEYVTIAIDGFQKTQAHRISAILDIKGTFEQVWHKLGKLHYQKLIKRNYLRDRNF